MRHHVPRFHDIQPTCLKVQRWRGVNENQRRNTKAKKTVSNMWTSEDRTLISTCVAWNDWEILSHVPHFREHIWHSDHNCTLDDGMEYLWVVSKWIARCQRCWPPQLFSFVLCPYLYYLAVVLFRKRTYPYSLWCAFYILWFLRGGNHELTTYHIECHTSILTIRS